MPYLQNSIIHDKEIVSHKHIAWSDAIYQLSTRCRVLMADFDCGHDPWDLSCETFVDA